MYLLEDRFGGTAVSGAAITALHLRARQLKISPVGEIKVCENCLSETMLLLVPWVENR